jgi:hypothetical protein
VVKLAAKLINCTKEKQPTIMCFFWAEGLPGAQIHLLVCADFGDKFLSRRIVYELIEMFENCCTIVIIAELSER